LRTDKRNFESTFLSVDSFEPLKNKNFKSPRVFEQTFFWQTLFSREKCHVVASDIFNFIPRN